MSDTTKQIPVPDGILLRPMTMSDYPLVHALWARTEGMCLRDADRAEHIERYLLRNPGLSVVATEHGAVVGAVLCGHDGRRGYLQHMAVQTSHRGRGIATAMVAWCRQALVGEGICKCHLLVHRDNDTGAAFWRSVGWHVRDDVRFMSATFSDAGPNA